MKNVIFAIIVVLSCATMSYAGTCASGSCAVRKAPVAAVVVAPVRVAVSIIKAHPIKKIVQTVKERKPVRKVLKRIFVR